jgi:hypothetical protein
MASSRINKLFTENETTHLINVRYVRLKNATGNTSKIHGEGW